MSRTLPIALIVAVAASIAPASANTARASKQPWPRAGTLVVGSLAARVAPDPHARVVHVFRQFRSDYRPQEILAVRETVGADGRVWDKLSLPMRPNGRYGWVPADSITVRPRVTRIVVRRSERRLRVYRGSRVLFSTPVAVGSKGRETPLGSFYVTARFVPDDSFLGTFAFETSAYSKMTDWPGGGVVGIHGTSQPWLLGRAVSHGCVRVSNAAAETLSHLVPLGTPISIVR
jgi:lipoprotein-anchoring transpeptidase ErfK/SrfK